VRDASSRSGLRAAVALALVVAAGCDRGPTFADACTPGAVTVQLTSPAAYFCHDPFKATVEVTNGSCDAITIQGITISASVVSGTCAPPADATLPPDVTTVAPGATVTVLDFTGAAFCCTSPGCPTPYQCDEELGFTVDTSAGPLVGGAATHLDLGGCTELCP
jgi:hypothetical protein